MSNWQELVAEAVRDLEVLSALCIAATRRHGDDWDAVWRDVRDGVFALAVPDRARLEAALTLMLRFQAPPTQRDQ